jgi:riboflavin kinase/FMN adenylyltransferase
MDPRCIQGLAQVGPAHRDAVLTIGNFDAVHLGHQRILSAARGLADRDGLAVVAMTFDPLPEAVLAPHLPRERLAPHEVRCQLLLHHGVDYVITLAADPGLMAMEARSFVEELVVAKLAPRRVVEGHDFMFGRGREGNIRTLRQIGAEAGFEVHVVEPVSIDLADGKRRVSSTLIRQLVLKGDVAQAGRCLGRPFALYGQVIPGQGRGRVLEFPTVNISPSEQIAPADGVYAGLARLGERRFRAAVSIGRKPTLGLTDQRYFEAFLLDAAGDFYHQPLELALLERLRDQQRFSGLEELKQQIARDVARVRELVSL